MSDAQFRQAERRWRETRSVQDEVAFLKERVRVGELNPEKLALAAHCGHVGAREIVGGSPAPDDTLENWILSLDRWGADVLVRAALALGCALEPGDQRVKRALADVEGWLKCPCDAHLAEVRKSGRFSNRDREASVLALAAVLVLETSNGTAVTAHDLLPLVQLALRRLGDAVARSALKAALQTLS